MIKIKIYKSGDEGQLEDAVNRYLEQVGKEKLINIKYSMAIQDNKTYHSAMVIYEEARDESNKPEKPMYE
jgi:hypothetical protein